MNRLLPGGLAALQMPQTPASYYTYGTLPPEIWPVRNQAPLTQAQEDQNDNLFGQEDEQEYAEGGDVQGALSTLSDEPMLARGPGDGRSDDIDAKLSDGEYVIDAETVALLGNGSIEAGAAALDNMRDQLRRHKGAQLAKGKFSPPAKSPLDYLFEGDE